MVQSLSSVTTVALDVLLGSFSMIRSCSILAQDLVICSLFDPTLHSLINWFGGSVSLDRCDLILLV